MNVAIVGPGRLGTMLAMALSRAGHRVVAVAGGSQESRERFAGKVAGTRFTSLQEACLRADLLLLATPDGEISALARELARADLVGAPHRVVHLAGSLGLEVLAPVARTGAGIAALHPAQTIPATAGPDALVGAAWGVTASAEDRLWAHALVTDLGGDPHDVRDQNRPLYHAALVLGSNAVAAAVSAARQLLLAVGVDDPAAFVSDLATRSVENVLAEGAGAITGPVVRGDLDTIARHLTALDADLPELAATYRHLQRAVLEQSAVALDPEVMQRMSQALGEGSTHP